MKQIIRLTESDLHRLVKESVRRILAETDASAAGGGALGGCNIMNGTSNETGGVAYPFGGGGNKKKVGGNPFNQSPIIRRPSPVGEPTNKKDKGIDMSDATDRTGGKNHSIAMNHVDESIIREAVNEGWKNWAMAGALGLLSFGNPQTANAQGKKDAFGTFGSVLAGKGASNKEIKSTARGFNPGNIMIRNANGEENSRIKSFLSVLDNVSSSMSTKNIKVFNRSEAEQRMKYLMKFNAKKAKKYKLFFDSNENAFLMPVNYTLQDVQRELGTLQLGDFDI